MTVSHQDASSQFRLSSGGPRRRLVAQLDLARRHVASDSSSSAISLSALGEAVSHFLLEVGLGEPSLSRRAASGAGLSRSAPGSPGGARSGREVQRRKDYRLWQRDEDARQRLSARLKISISHDEISLEED